MKHSGALLYLLSFVSLLHPALCQWQQIHSSLEGEDTGDFFGFDVKLSHDGSLAFIGGHGGGYVKIFQRGSNDWIETQRLTGIEEGDNFGYSIDVSRDNKVLAIGAYNGAHLGPSTGYAQLFRNDNGSWTSLYTAVGEASGDRFGFCVALSADGATFAVGAMHAGGSDAGHVKVFRKSSFVYSQLHPTIIGRTIRENFGISVDLSDDGNTVAIGAHMYNSKQGLVKVYREGINSWDQVHQTLFGTSTGTVNNMGYDVSLSGDGKTLAVSEPWNPHGATDGGKVLIYREGPNSWEQVLDIRGRSHEASYGYSLELSSDGKTLAFSSYYNKWDNNGKILVYREETSGWQQLYQTIPGEVIGMGWGMRIALSGDGFTLAIGGQKYDGNSGIARIYERSDITRRPITAPPTSSPTKSPTPSPTSSPTKSPTASPSASPTPSPTNHPTSSPTKSPTPSPTSSPSKSPTASPSASPTPSPTNNPTSSPTKSPTPSPTSSPSKSPTASPTASPTPSPTNNPTSSPTKNPTASPTEFLNNYFINGTAFKKPDASSIITIETSFGGMTDDTSIKIFNKGCEDNVSNGALTILHTKNFTDSDMKQISDVHIHTNKLVGSNVLSTGSTSISGTIEFCVETVAYESGWTQDAIAVSSLRSNYFVAFSGTDKEFEIGHIDIVEEAAIDNTLEDEEILDLGINFVRCSDSSVAEHDASPEENIEGETIFVCLTPNSNTTEISDLNLNAIYGNGILPLITSGNPLPVLVTVETVGSTTRVAFPILFEFFNGNNTQLFISGDADVGFIQISGGSSKVGVDDMEKINFGLNIELTDPGANGCFQKLIQKLKRLGL